MKKSSLNRLAKTNYLAKNKWQKPLILAEALIHHTSHSAGIL